MSLKNIYDTYMENFPEIREELYKEAAESAKQIIGLNKKAQEMAAPLSMHPSTYALLALATAGGGYGLARAVDYYKKKQLEAQQVAGTYYPDSMTMGGGYDVS